MDIKIIFSFAKGRDSMPKGSHLWIIRIIKNCDDFEVAKKKARELFPNPLYKIVNYNYVNQNEYKEAIREN